MTIYDHIYAFLETYIFNDDGYAGLLNYCEYDVGTYMQEPVIITLQGWLCHTVTIIIMCAIVFFAYWLVRWIFKAVSSAFLLK